MQDALEVAGLACFAAAGFTVAVPLGFAACGLALLLVAWRRAR